MRKALENCGKTSKYQRTCNRNPKRRGKRESIREKKKKFDEIMPKHFPNLIINFFFTDPRNSMNSIKRNTKPSISRHMIVKLLKAKEKEKILKAVSEKKAHDTERN